MEAIHTKLIPSTHTKPTRIRVSVEQQKAQIFSWERVEDGLLSCRDAPDHQQRVHAGAARLYLRALGWNNRFVSGQLPDGSYAHVLCPSE